MFEPQISLLCPWTTLSSARLCGQMPARHKQGNGLVDLHVSEVPLYPCLRERGDLLWPEGQMLSGDITSSQPSVIAVWNEYLRMSKNEMGGENWELICKSQRQCNFSSLSDCCLQILGASRRMQENCCCLEAWGFKRLGENLRNFFLLRKIGLCCNQESQTWWHVQWMASVQ